MFSVSRLLSIAIRLLVVVVFQVRIKFVTKDESIRVTEVPLAVPTQLGRKVRRRGSCVPFVRNSLVTSAP